MPLLDYLSDKNPAWLRLFDNSLPEWVKDAAHPQPEELTKLARVAFADPLHRLHPVHTPAATFSSLAYLLAHDASDNSPEVLTVKAAAAKWGIEPAEILAVEAELQTHVKSAAISDVEIPLVALSVKNASAGDTDHFYDLSTAALIAESAEEVARDFSMGKLPITWCRDACQNIKEAALHRGLPLDELPALINDMCVDHLIDYARSHQLAEMRKYAKVGEHLATYHDIIDSVEANAITPDDGVEMIEALDASLGVKYANVQVRPLNMIFAGPSQDEVVKMATSGVILNGVWVPAGVLSVVPEAEVRMTMAAPIADAVCGVIKMAKASPATATVMVEQLAPEVQRAVLELTVNAAAGLPAAA